MNKQKWTSYLKFLIVVSCIFIVILLVFFKTEMIINTNTMTKDFYNEYMYRDTQKYSMILLIVLDFIIFMLYSVSVVGVMDKVDRCGLKDLVKFLKTKYLFIITMVILVIIKKVILNMVMEYHIAVYFITPLIVAIISLRYISKE